MMGGWMRMKGDLSVGLRPFPSGRPCRKKSGVWRNVSCWTTASRKAAEAAERKRSVHTRARRKPGGRSFHVGPPEGSGEGRDGGQGCGQGRHGGEARQRGRDGCDREEG